MHLDRDFSEFVGFLSAHEVRFLLVGDYAVADNAERLVRALDDFGFGSVGLTAADFPQPHRAATRQRVGDLRTWPTSMPLTAELALANRSR